MYELTKIGKVLTSKSVQTRPLSYGKRIYRATVSQRLRNTGLRCWYAAVHLLRDCGFKSCQGHGWISPVSVVCCQADHLSRGVLPTVVCLNVIISASLV